MPIFNANFGHTALLAGFFLAKNGNYIFDRNNKKLVVGLEVDRNGVLGMEEHLVILAKRDIFIMGDLATDGNDATCDGRYLSGVWQRNPTFGFAFGFILQYQDSRTDRFNVLERCLFFGHKAISEWEIGYESHAMCQLRPNVMDDWLVGKTILSNLACV